VRPAPQAVRPFNLGALIVEPTEHCVVFSQHAIASDRGPQGELRHRGQVMLAPQQLDMRPAPGFLAWNFKNVVSKTPGRRWMTR
jgi:putative restriction endonuclease